jgi:hypothetical protein
MASVLVPWGVELALITARNLGVNIPGSKPWATGSAHKVAGLPLPADYLATFLIFMPLAIAGDNPQFGSIAALVGWGYVLATLLTSLDPTDPMGKKAKNPVPQQGTPGAPTGTTQVGGYAPARFGGIRPQTGMNA